MNAAINDPDFFDASQGLLENDVKLTDGDKGANNKVQTQKVSLKHLDNICKNIQGDRAAGGSAFNANLLDYLGLLAANVPGELGQQFLALHERAAEHLSKVNVPGEHGFDGIEKRAIDQELQLGMVELRKFLDEQLSKQKRM